MTRRPPLPLAARVARDVMGWKEGAIGEPHFWLHPGFKGARQRWAVTAENGEPWDPLANPADLMDVIGAILDRGGYVETKVGREAGTGRLSAYAYISTDQDLAARTVRITRGDWRSALARAVCWAALEAMR